MPMPLHRAACTAFIAALSAGALLGQSTRAFAQGAPPITASAEQKEEAQTRFLRGRDLFAKRKYRDALAQFRASLDVVASPNAHLFVARTLVKTGDLAAAFAEFRATETEAKQLAADDARYEKTAEAAAAEYESLEPRIALLTVNVLHANELTTLRAGAATPAKPPFGMPIPLPPGSIDIVVTKPGHENAHQTLQLEAGEKRAIDIDAGDDSSAAASAPSDREAVCPPSRLEASRPFAPTHGSPGAWASPGSPRSPRSARCRTARTRT